MLAMLSGCDCAWTTRGRPNKPCQRVPNSEPTRFSRSDCPWRQQCWVYPLSDELSALLGLRYTSTTHGLNYMPAMLIGTFIEWLAGMVDGVGHMGHHTDVGVTCLCESKQ